VAGCGELVGAMLDARGLGLLIRALGGGWWPVKMMGSGEGKNL
jgi:hypothetical protein